MVREGERVWTDGDGEDKVRRLQTVTRSRSFQGAMAGHEALRQASIALLRTVLPTTKGIRLLGVTVPNFDQDAEAKALPLFGANQE